MGYKLALGVEKWNNVMNKITYTIEYGVYFGANSYESHVINIKNCMSEMHAKVKLEGYLRKKYPTFSSLVVYRCDKSIMDMFSDIFDVGKSWGF